MLERGMKGSAVREVQEWLCLQGHHLRIDGSFGPATEAAVCAFQDARGMTPTGKVSIATLTALQEPLTRATAITIAGEAVGPAVVSYAEQHLREHPREIGGQNCGPWVRLYMNGNEGREWPWCAGFSTYVVKQAITALQRSMPIRRTFSCDSLAAAAKEQGTFISETAVGDGDLITPGCLFLTRRTPGDWTHVGIVVRAHDEFVETIEGNTNDAGDREGYEVCRRTRGYRRMDFIRIA